MRENNEAKAALEKRTIPPAVDCDLPAPPVPLCTPEEYDQWFRSKVQDALDDPRPALPFDEAMVKLDALLEIKHRARSQS